ncbi:MAG: HAD-IIIA family hydrolase [Candidatus Lokiarchaeota archaeon]|nr:HAD-IIIA family hydrolase [Candidatus Lokiarchaeota archaeon]
MGYPAIGKSTFAQKYTEHEYYRLNRDKLGCKLKELVPEMDKLYKEGKGLFVLDNTYMTSDSRAPVITWAKEHKIPIKCVWITSRTPEAIEVAQYNAVKRMLDKYGKILTNEEIKEQRDPNIFPPVVLFSFRKKFEKPTKKEGFDASETIQFQRIMDKKIYKNKAIILDYDGTLRKTKSGGKYPKDPNDIEILPHRKSILKKFVNEGYILLGVSNQSFVSKGTLTYQQAEACFNRTNELLGFDIDYKFCPHKAFPLNCYCRKPMPGFGVEFIEKYKLDPDKTIMVGDQTTDKTFARRSGIRFIHADDFFKIDSNVVDNRENNNAERTKVTSSKKTKELKQFKIN